MQENIAIDKAFIVGIKKAYDKAVKEGQAGFIYEDHEFVTTYVKYLLEYYAPQFGVKL